MIKETNGTIIINHAVNPVTLSPLSKDDGKGIEMFEFPTSTLNANHTFAKRDFGRSVASDGMVVQKGKFSVIKELVTANGKRRTQVQTVSLSRNAEFTTAETEQQMRDLGQFILDNATDLANGRFSS